MKDVTPQQIEEERIRSFYLSDKDYYLLKSIQYGITNTTNCIKGGCKDCIWHFKDGCASTRINALIYRNERYRQEQMKEKFKAIQEKDVKVVRMDEVENILTFLTINFYGEPNAPAAINQARETINKKSFYIINEKNEVIE